MGTVVVSGTTHTILGELGAAVSYLAASLHATAWNAIVPVSPAAADPDPDRYDNAARRRSIALVGATRWFATLDWAEGVAPATEPDLVNASYELAAALLADPTLVTKPSGKNIKRVDAGGGVGVEFFGPVETTAGDLPFLVARLIGPYLASVSATAGGSGVPVTGGTCHRSSFDCDDDFDLTGP